MAKMTNQVFFNKVLKHMAQMPKRSMNDSGNTCVYLSETSGNCCAIGAVLPKKLNVKVSKACDHLGESVLQATDRVPEMKEYLSGVNMDLMLHTQDFHDGDADWTVKGPIRKNSLREFAIDTARAYDLKLPSDFAPKKAA